MVEKILEDINQTALLLLRATSLEDRYKIIVNEATKSVAVDFGTIFLHKEGELERVFSTVPGRRRLKPRKKGYTYETFVTGHAKVMPSAVLKKVHGSLYDKGVRSLVLIPLSIQDERVGVLALQSEENKKFTKLELQKLELFGTLATLAIRNSQFFSQMQDSIKARDLFISLASHELKTPLTTISVYADLISKKIHSKQMPPETAADILTSEIERLKNIVNDLLEFDQIMSGDFRYRWQDLNIIDVIKKSIINFKTTNPSYRVILENNIPRKLRNIQGDPEKLQQSFSNILTNASKFSSSFTPILIQADVVADEIISVSFSDFGKGMKKSDQDKIFNEFVKGEGNRKQGMGLGLYLVKRIIEEHKGKVRLFSKLNKGTKLTILLPTKLYDLPS